MITKYKIFERVNQGEPEGGDYVICKDTTEPEINIFSRKNIGKIIQIEPDLYPFEYLVKYDSVPYDLKDKIKNKTRHFSRGGRQFSLKEIEYSSKNREDCVKYLKFKKFNLK